MDNSTLDKEVVVNMGFPVNALIVKPDLLFIEILLFRERLNLTEAKISMSEFTPIFIRTILQA